MSLPALEQEMGACLCANKNRVATSPLLSLQELICTTLDFEFFEKHPNLFHQLPDAILQYMLSLPDCKLRLPQYFHLAVRAGRRCVMIPCHSRVHDDKNVRKWNTERANGIMDCVIQHCPRDSLEKFGFGLPPSSPHIEDCVNIKHTRGFQYPGTEYPKPDLERVHAILKKQTKLEEIDLNLVEYNVTKTTLRIIGDNCHGLRFLSLNLDDEMNEDKVIDLDTMRHLVDGCSSLEDVKLHCAGKTQGAVIYTLQHLRHLVHFEAPIRDIATFSESGGIVPPNWQPSVSCQDESDLNNLALVQAVCPKVHALEIDDSNVQDLTRYQFKSIKELRIFHLKDHTIPQIEPFLRECGAQVTELTLFAAKDLKPSNVTLDLSAVTEHCPNLEALNIWGVPISNTCEHSVTPEKVQYLRCLSLVDIPPHANTPPDDFLYPIITNGDLEHFEVPAVSRQLLERMTGEMRAAAVEAKPSSVFPNLSHLFVKKVGQADMSLRQAVGLVSLTPRLKYVEFGSLSASGTKGLKKFINQFF